MSLAVIKSLEAQIESALKDVSAKQAALQEAVNYAKEMERQARVHSESGYKDGLDWANSVLTNQAYPAITTADQNLKRSEGILAGLNSQLAAAKASLTPIETEALTVQLQQQTTANQVALEESKARLIATQADASKTNYAQKTTTYIVVGVVVLIIIAGVSYFIYKKKKAQ